MRTDFAEQSVIGGMILFPDETGSAYGQLGAEMFEHPYLAEIYAVCAALHKAGEPVDAVTVDARTGAKHRVLLAECFDLMPSISGFETYVQLVRDAWRRRTVAESLQKVVYTLQEPASNVVDSVVEIERIAAVQREIENRIRDESAKGFIDSMVEFYNDLASPDDAIKTGWRDFDQLTGGLQRQGVYVISARSGSGKTDFAINLAMSLAKRVKVYYSSMEMPRKQLMRRVIAKGTRINSARLRDRTLTPEEFQAIARVIDMMSAGTQITLDEQQRMTVQDVEEKILRYRPDVIFLDHLGLMQHDPRKKNQWEAIGETTKRLKKLALKYRVVIVELVQRNRSSDVNRGRPVMSELKGSSDIENDADSILMITADTEGRILSGNDFVSASVHVLKNRHGGTGILQYNWQPQYHTWRPVDRQREG